MEKVYEIIKYLAPKNGFYGVNKDWSGQNKSFMDGYRRALKDVRHLVKKAEEK